MLKVPQSDLKVSKKYPKSIPKSIKKVSKRIPKLFKKCPKSIQVFNPQSIIPMLWKTVSLAQYNSINNSNGPTYRQTDRPTDRPPDRPTKRQELKSLYMAGPLIQGPEIRGQAKVVSLLFRDHSPQAIQCSAV